MVSCSNDTQSCERGRYFHGQTVTKYEFHAAITRKGIFIICTCVIGNRSPGHMYAGSHYPRSAATHSQQPVVAAYFHRHLLIGAPTGSHVALASAVKIPFHTSEYPPRATGHSPIIWTNLWMSALPSRIPRDKQPDGLLCAGR
jgi:hypothetical protein